MSRVLPVVLCGGSGSRLWPLSRDGFPKQFLSLTGSESLFQQAVTRLIALAQTGIQVDRPLVVCNEEHRFLASEQIREMGAELGALLLEPVGRNTAPALTLAALAAGEDGDDPILIVSPSDQTVGDPSAFNEAMIQAIELAGQGRIVIFGVRPDRPETGYGYIQVTPCTQVLRGQAHDVQRFVEKPDAATAQGYLDQGGYFWNSGIFVLKASTWLRALATFCPEIERGARSAWDARTSDAMSATTFIRPGISDFEAICSVSIDNAVIERCPGSGFPISMVLLEAGWSDLGAWDAVWQVLPRDEYGNANSGDVISCKSRNNMVYSSTRLVSLVGVQDLIVIETADAVLVADRRCSQYVKNIVEHLKCHGRAEHALHRKVHRPWGWYDSVDEGGRFKVKRIQVKPLASLSLQKHYHRAEHWIVVRGTAEITCGDKVVLLSENQSTFIPLGEVHRLANPGKIPLEIIEVQSGSYLGEDDIVRLDDTYGRSQ